MTTAMDMVNKINPEKEIFSIIYVDWLGCKIQATVRKTTIYMFKQLLSEDRVYVMKLFSVVPNQGSYRATRHQIKLIFYHRIRCALFSEYVDELNRFLSSRYAEQPVVVLQLAKVKVFRGLYHVNFYFSSILHGVSASQSIGIVGSGKNIGIEEDFLKLTPRSRIAKIVEDGPWWYFACVCDRGVQTESGIYFCQFCNIHVTNVTPRFRVKVLVEDSTCVSIFVLFDREASYLLNKTCAQLFEQHLKDVDVVFGTQSPLIFQDIVEKIMMFKVLIWLVGMEKFKGSYLVRRVCDDVAILGMFELSDSDLSPEKAGFVPKGEGSFGEPSKVTESLNLGLTPSSCSELFAGSPKCTQPKSSVVDLGVDEDVKEYVVGLNQGSLDSEKDVKPSLKRLRRSLRLQFDEVEESCGSGNDGSSGHRVN
ncbi:hypothetical protein Ahy_A09g043513 [Arachis hypogaea]|uniref:Replication factor A C-terminal domain-containing protein n=1 Tax=Arachis hypogaea TaxID=3818 RepID=A0A445BIF5_ARAHY|nr:hypothetical protein Ahy_A09g043513 [Arachis hypogaea]